MTRVRRILKHRRVVDLPPPLRAYLETGEYRDTGSDFAIYQLAGSTLRGDFSRVRDLWDVHGAALLDDWLDENPGTRPFTWWLLIAPEPRRVLAGAEMTLAVAHPEHFAHEATWRRAFGIPVFIPCRPRDCGALPIVESEAAYLDRHGLLDAEERAALDADAFEPEEINPFVHTKREELKP